MSNLILLVEDNPTDEKLTLRAFQRCSVPHEIFVVRDGVDAIDYLSASGKFADRDASALPRMVVLDLKLPRVDGLEVIRRVRASQRTALLPIVVLTASREDEDIMRCYTLGANAYVRKPVDFTQSVETANAICVFWLLVNEPPPLSHSTS